MELQTPQPEKPEINPNKAYHAWRGSPSRETTGNLLKHLQPTIDQGVNVYAGGSASPILRSRAKRLALTAVQSYDPNRNVRLTTHVMNHLQGLRRVARQEDQIIHVPERIGLDQATLHRAEQDLEDRLGRHPTTDEVADHTGLSHRRIARIRTIGPAVSEGQRIDPETGEEQAVASAPYRRDEIISRAVYDDLMPRDQKIMEWTLGMHGEQQLDNRTIAAKLGVSPGAVSQRKALIQQQLNQITSSHVF